MSTTRKKYPKEIRVQVSEELHSAISGLAERRGETVSDICRRHLEIAISDEAANDGLDTFVRVIRENLKDILKPTEERLAALNAKTAIASATSMYLNTQVIANAGQDAKTIYEESRKKAVQFVQAKQN